MAYTPANATPPHILNAAIRAYVQTAEPVDAICDRLGISHATLHRERRARGLPPRPRHPLPPRPRVLRVERYAAEPQTERQRRVWAAWQAAPEATTHQLAAVSGVSQSYASRLVGHWQAMERGRRRLEEVLGSGERRA
jgi:hypothetical protein